MSHGLFLSVDGAIEPVLFDNDSLISILHSRIAQSFAAHSIDGYTIWYDQDQDEGENVVASKLLDNNGVNFILGPVFITGSTTSAGNQRSLTTRQIKYLANFAQRVNPFHAVEEVDLMEEVEDENNVDESTPITRRTRPPPLNLDEEDEDDEETGLSTSESLLTAKSSNSDSSTQEFPPAKRLCSRTFMFQMAEDDPFPEHATAEILHDGTLVIE